MSDVAIGTFIGDKGKRSVPLIAAASLEIDGPLGEGGCGMVRSQRPLAGSTLAAACAAHTTTMPTAVRPPLLARCR